MGFEAARRNADVRLNQELIRIRNLPKRNKITLAATKNGLRHASHTNTGLLRELEINLNLISREQRRVASECDKKQKQFRDYQKKSFSKFLPPLDEKPQAEAKGTRAKQQVIFFEQAPTWIKSRRQRLTDLKREMVLSLKARSKDKTQEIISENSRRTSITDENSWITQLNRRQKDANGGSYFPFVLERADAKRRRASRPRNQLSPIHENATITDGAKPRTFRGLAYEKVIRMPDPMKIPHLNPWDPKLYYVVIKVLDRNRKKMSKLQKADFEVAKRNSAFTKHWK